MAFDIRPLELSDYEDLARLVRHQEVEAVSVETLLDRDRRLTSGTIRHRFVGCADGNVVGFAQCTAWGHDRAGKFWLRSAVDPASRNRGLGTRLHDLVERMAAESGATDLWIEVRDHDADSVRFAKKRGFAQQAHMFESVLDLATFDSAIGAGALAKVQANGYRILRYAELEDDEANRRKFWELHMPLDQDLPGPEVNQVVPFDDYVRLHFGACWFDAAGLFIAEQEGRWVGFAQAGEVSPGAFYNIFTGVLQGHRGQGLAFALKVLATEFCRDKGAATVRTNNDSTNAAMLAINEKLGYRAQPGWLVCSKLVNP